MPPRTRTVTVPIDQIGQSILILRGQRVLLDSDLAALYGVTTKRLNEQVKRNIDRFSEDFMFPLRAQEWDALRSQITTSKVGSSFSNLRSQNATFAALESRLNKRLADHDVAIVAILSAIRELMNSPSPKGRGIGLTAKI
jgi:transposase